jgi:mono/diheme cytochrome c family protein
MTDLRRRDLLVGTALVLVGEKVTRAGIIAGQLPWAPNAASPPPTVRPDGWEFFTAAEAAAVEALADRVIPPDTPGGPEPHTPGGKDAGCAVFIDRQLGGDKSAESLRGYSIQGWFAPNITNDERGLAGWTIEDIVDYLKKGHNRFAAASGPMAEEVSDSSSKMSRADLTAIATYLKNLQATKGVGTPVAASDPVMVAGAAIYSDLCSACHKPDGTGIPYLIPNLAATASVASREPTTLIRVVLEGAQSVATDEEPTGPAMPPFGWQLTDAQVAAVTTYVSNSWNHAAATISERQVHEARETLGPDRD